eukprot:8281712-Prorocentrum_lima.AAC.1
MHCRCHSKSQWIEDFYHFCSTMAMLPPPITSMEDVRCCIYANPNGYDQRTSVHVIAGHVKCNWEQIFMSAHNREEFEDCFMDSLERKGVYPLNSCDWYMAQPLQESAPLNLFET